MVRGQLVGAFAERRGVVLLDSLDKMIVWAEEHRVDRRRAHSRDGDENREDDEN